MLTMCKRELCLFVFLLGACVFSPWSHWFDSWALILTDAIVVNLPFDKTLNTTYTQH
jgi:hypothetical protein